MVPAASNGFLARPFAFGGQNLGKLTVMYCLLSHAPATIPP